MRLYKFLISDSGAVTVDWTVLAAAVVGLGVASVAAVRTGVGSLGSDISQSLSGASVFLPTHFVQGVTMVQGGFFNLVLSVGPGGMRDGASFTTAAGEIGLAEGTPDPVSMRNAGGLSEGDVMELDGRQYEVALLLEGVDGDYHMSDGSVVRLDSYVTVLQDIDNPGNSITYLAPVTVPDGMGSIVRIDLPNTGGDRGFVADFY